MEDQNIDYAKFVGVLFKPGEEILASLTPEKCQLLHAAMGLAGEAGELLDAIKKHVMYGKPLDIKNVREESGDIEFFHQALRNVLRISREEILAENNAKLSKRYPKGYSDQAAQARADKVQHDNVGGLAYPDCVRTRPDECSS